MKNLATGLAGHRGGAGNCLACSLPADEQSRLNADLVRGVPLYRLAKRWNINRASLRSHKDNHVSPAETALTIARSSDSPVVERAELLVRHADAMYESARVAGNLVLGLKALTQQRESLELVAKLRGLLDDRPQVTINLQQTHEWQQVQMVVMRFVEERLSPRDADELSRRLRVLDGELKS